MPTFMRGGGEFRMDDRSIEGTDLLLLRELFDCILELVEDRRVKVFYIGKGSGESVGDALYARDDRYKQENGINYAMALYRSRKASYTSIVEQTLIRFFIDHPKCINRTLRAAGRPSLASTHVVYVAVRVWG